MTERTLDIDCDLGESFGNWSLGRDEEVMPRRAATDGGREIATAGAVA